MRESHTHTRPVIFICSGIFPFSSCISCGNLLSRQFYVHYTSKRACVCVCLCVCVFTYTYFIEFDRTPTRKLTLDIRLRSPSQFGELSPPRTQFDISTHPQYTLCVRVLSQIKCMLVHLFGNIYSRTHQSNNLYPKPSACKMLACVCIPCKFLGTWPQVQTYRVFRSSVCTSTHTHLMNICARAWGNTMRILAFTWFKHIFSK